MKFNCYSSWDKIPASANNLYESSENNSIFYSQTWFECISLFSEDKNLSISIACVESGSQVFAILPLMISDKGIAYSLKHRYTPHYSLLLHHKNQNAILNCMVQGLMELSIKGLLLEPVSKSDENLNKLVTIFNSEDYTTSYTFRHYNWIYRNQGESFNDYIAKRPARLRNTIARKKRKLEREQSYDIRLYQNNDVPQYMPDYYAVYNSSWKAHEQYRHFLDTIVAEFSKSGWTRLAILYINSQPAAAQLWFVCQNKASIFRLAYDEKWKHYSTGSILTCYLMQHVIDTDKVNEIDFLTGNESYKQDWMTERRECYLLGLTKNTRPTAWYHLLLNKFKK